MDTPELIIPYGRINSRMTSYLKIFVLIDFHFQDAIFPFNRAAPYGMTSAVPREQSRTSARSAERTLALDPRPHSSAAARASLRFLVRSAAERRTSRGEISFQLPFKHYPIKDFGSNRANKSEIFSPQGCSQLPEIQNLGLGHLTQSHLVSHSDPVFCKNVNRYSSSDWSRA